MSEEQLIYSLIEMDVFADQLKEDEAAAPPINIALVLDCSTSMKGERLEILKASAIELIHQLRPQDFLSVIAFNDRAETIIPAANQANNRKNESRIWLLQAKGGTEIFQGLDVGISQVQRNISPYYINHVILVTDGHTYGDESNCQELAKEAENLNIGISGLGIGGKWNDVFLDSLSKITGGSSFYIHHPRAIRTLLNRKFNALGQVQVEGIKLNFRTGPGVTSNYTYRLEPEANALPLTSPISLGYIPKGNRLSIIIEFLLSPIKPNIQKVLLAEGSITFKLPTRDKTVYRLPVNLSLLTGAKIQQPPPNKSIIEAISRLTLVRMQEQARKEITDGKYQEASTRLQNMATHLLSRCETDLAKTAMKEAANIESNKKISEDGQKRIKYGTVNILANCPKPSQPIMVSCPSSKHKELYGALFCSKFGSQLISAEASNTSGLETTVIESYDGMEVPAFPPPSADATDSLAALIIMSNGVAINIKGKGEFTLGRSSKGQTTVPDIDLNPYDAYEAGVSRLHANINVLDSMVTIHDLGSANGTRLNGDRIESHTEYTLTHGIILTFGQLKVQILIKE